MTDSFIPASLEVALGTAEMSPGKGRPPVEAFVKLHLSGAGKLVKLLGLKKIQSRDLAVLLVMVSMMELRSNRTRVKASKISELLNASQNNVYLSIKRLREQKIIVKSCDKRTGEIVYMVSPYIFSGGSPKQRGFKIVTYNESIQADYPDYVPDPVDD